MSRKPHLPTDPSRQMVKGLIGCGFKVDDVAKMLAIDPKTLRKHYPAELDTGHLTANAAVAQSLFKKATAGTGKDSVTAAIFWLKARAGWRDKIDIEHSGEIEHLIGTTREIVDPQAQDHDA